MDYALPNTDALLQLHPGAANGLMLGSRLDIPPGYAGVLVKDGKAFDTLPPGSHVIDQATLPLLMQKMKPRSGANEIMPLPASVFLIQTSLPRSLLWGARVILTQSAAYGLTYTTLEGKCAVQVADPARFCAVVLSTGGKALSQPGVSPAQVADYVLQAGLSARAAEAVGKMKLSPEQAIPAREAIRTAVGQQAAQWASRPRSGCTISAFSAIRLTWKPSPSRT